MKSFTITYSIHASIHDVWEALVDPTIIAKWGGDIHGTNTKVVAQKLLVQDWYSGDWKEPSVVTFELSGNTKIKLTHTNIPDGEFSSIKSGWDDYYMLPMKKFVEST